MIITAAISRAETPVPHLEEVELEDPRAHEVLVRIVATGICHTDINSHAGRGLAVPKPIVLGHEGAGIVEAIGVGVTTLHVGDHVVLSGGSCGECSSCMSARPTYCRHAMLAGFGGARLDGSSPISQNGQPIAGYFFGQSSFGTYAIASARTAVRVPKDVPLHLLGPLACGMITGAGSIIEALKVRPGQSVVVYGTGGVGLAAIMAAKLAGASRIVAVDVNATRLALAVELGASDTVPSDENVDNALRAILPDGFDFSFVTAAHPSVYTSAVACLAVEGTCGIAVAPHGYWAADAGYLLAGGRKLQGIIGGSANPHTFIPMLIEYWRQGRFPFDRLIKTYEFSDIALAWSDATDGSAIKPVLLMPEE
ncbi:NAD(P)-dependent alcohol dehydrogenase [Agrobacterium deltaense]|uniref:NAD(P)-dependent alcohol dehydrogenase n=1 Tax=Agrobacterium deltaense TaxID=1183412 RepID=UPI0009BA4A48|nr:NAD(P)-dependent alcohol dehydrogenase [Agrobacterium deltaense]CUX56469.1 Aryl-alcohol dehydrogenase [Agrobacterium deltaense RV3]